jgi:hypothetical protein
MSTRRQFLAGLGISVPATLSAIPPVNASPAGGPLPMSPADVFEAYVEAYLRSLPEWMAKRPGAVHRTLAQSQGFALARVLAELQARRP